METWEEEVLCVLESLVLTIMIMYVLEELVLGEIAQVLHPLTHGYFITGQLLLTL